MRYSKTIVLQVIFLSNCIYIIARAGWDLGAPFSSHTLYLLIKYLLRVALQTEFVLGADGTLREDSDPWIDHGSQHVDLR